ncbi:Paraquat-inducible protein A [Balamuthia mandrillaris]
MKILLSQSIAMPNKRNTSVSRLATAAWVLLVLSFAAVPTAAFDQNALQNIISESCGLRCWLHNITIHIPDQSFSVGTFTLALKNIICSSIDLGALDSSLSGLAVSLKASGIGITCSASWKLSGKLLPSASGGLQAHILPDSTTLQTQLELTKDADGLASSAKLNYCDMSLHITVDFTGGGLVDSILQLFRDIIASSLQSVLKDVICEELTTAVSNNLTKVLQNVNNQIRPFLHPQPPSPSPLVPPGSVHLRDNPTIAILDYLLDTVIGADGPLGLNKIANFLTNGTGRIEATGIKGAQVTVSLSSLANITFGLTGFGLAGINTWKTFDLIVPVNAYTLDSQTYMDRLDLNFTFFVNVSVADGTVVSASKSLYESALMSMSMKDNMLSSDVVLALRNHILPFLKPDQLNMQCILSTVEVAEITNLAFNISLTQLALVALGGDVEQDLDEAIDNIIALFTSSFRPAIPAFMNGVIAGPGRDRLNKYFAGVVAQNHTCPVSHWEGGNIDDLEVDMLAVILTSSIGGAVIILLVAVLLILQILNRQKKRQQRSSRHFLADVDDPATEGLVASINNDPGAHLQAKKSSSCEPCLALHSHVAWYFRYGIPMVIVINVALFINANISIGASVYAIVQLGLDEVQLPPLFPFSLGSSVRDMWKAGVYPLSLLVAVFSGAWPYLKLILLFLCWMLPVRILSAKRRETVLRVVDALGKWSLIDAYIMILMLVAFHENIISPAVPESGTKAGAAGAQFVVAPKSGFYLFLLATITSLVVTHVILACHRRAANWRRRHEIARLEHKLPSEAVGAHSFRVGHTLVRCTWLGRALVTVLLLITTALMIVGSVLESFSFRTEGLAAVAIEFLGYPVQKDYSVLTLGEAIPAGAYNPNGVGVHLIQSTFFIFAVAVPLCHLVFLLTLWLAPLRPVVQKYMFMMTEVLNAWSALDVFVISIIAALLEIEQFAQFIIGDKCDLINEILKEYLQPVLPGMDKCYDVVATLQWGCWILFTACVIYWIAGYLVMQLCHKILEERSDKAYRSVVKAAQQHREAAYSSSSSSSAEATASSPDGSSTFKLSSNDYAKDMSAFTAGSEKLTWLAEEQQDTRCGPAIRAVAAWLYLIQEVDVVDELL